MTLLYALLLEPKKFYIIGKTAKSILLKTSIKLLMYLVFTLNSDKNLIKTGVLVLFCFKLELSEEILNRLHQRGIS